MSRLILHIGLHKTGTTTIQNCLGKGRSELLAHSIVYPEFEGHFYHHGLATVWINLPTQYSFTGDPLSYWKKLHDDYSDAQTAIVSSEELSRQYPVSVDYAYLSEITKGFDIVDIALVLRHQVDYLQSIYLEISKGSNYLDFRQFLEDSIATEFADGLYLDYLTLYKKILCGFNEENINILSYNRFAECGTNFVICFLDDLLVNIRSNNLQQILKASKANQSADPLSMWVAQNLLYQKVPTATEISVVRQAIEDEFGNECRTTIFTRDEVDYLINRYYKSNSEFEFITRHHDAKFNFPHTMVECNFVFREDVTKIVFEHAKNFLKVCSLPNIDL